MLLKTFLPIVSVLSLAGSLFGFWVGYTVVGPTMWNNWVDMALLYAKLM